MLKQNKTKHKKTNKMTKKKKKRGEVRVKRRKQKWILSIVINELARMAHLNVGHVIRVGLKSIGRGSSVCSRSVSTNGA